MRTVSIYSLADGVFTGRRVTGDERVIAEQTPDGCGSIDGHHDHLTRRVDLVTGQVIDYLPPKPADDELRCWVLSEDGRRWVDQPTDAAIALQARAERNRRLAATAWVRERAADHGVPVPRAWLEYWQALRDVTTQAGWPRCIDWPTPPQD